MNDNKSKLIAKNNLALTEVSKDELINGLTQRMNKYKTLISEKQKEFDRITFEHKATGRTTRIVNEVIDQFFKQPIGSKILLIDHFPDPKHLVFEVERRLNKMYPKIKYTISLDQNKFYLTRITPKFSEQLCEDIDKAKEEIAEIKERLELLK